MASEDVIELGSSDDEAEPAPKKSKKMPPKDAMVCIPRKLHDPTKKTSNINPVSLAKGLGGAVTVKRIIKPKSKGPDLKISNVRGSFKQVNPFAAPHSATNLKKIMPPSLKPVTPSKLPILKSKHPHDVLIRNLKVKTIPTKPVPLQSLNIKINSTSSLKLPSGITLKRKTGPSPMCHYNTVKSNHKGLVPHKTNSSKSVHEMIDLDEEECTPAASNPQWYLRPEEQESLTDPLLEEENNKEPEASKMIEITIEDSPVKPVSTQNKRVYQVGEELAITIDDSPIKPTPKATEDSGSEEERELKKDPNSKKKLEYPKETETENIVEIEIEPFEVSTETKTTEETNNVCTDSTSSKNKLEPPAKVIIVDKVQTSTDNEFHPVYQTFINLCFELENSDDMKKIVEKKIKSYYLQVPKEYTESEEFIDMVSSKILAIKAGPEKMYLYIKDIVDELNMQRKLAKTQPAMETKTEESPEFLYGEDSEYDAKRQRQIRKLEKTIKKLHRAIQKLEEQEVDFDDDDDSVYLLTERYKERMVRVYAKFCQLTNTKMPSEPRIQLDARPGRPSGPAKRLEKWINKKVPIGTPLPFPDFHDVLNCVRQANNEDKLGWNEVDIMEEARNLFERCGKKLQRRRQENEWRLAASRIVSEVDPAETSTDLKKKLDDNRKVAAKKETEIFNKYADRQNMLKLEAVEIGDKEAEESPVESEEDEANDESVSLVNKDKRKERLKRLLQEKSKKSSEEKENHIKDGNLDKQNDEDSPEQKNQENANENKAEEASSKSAEKSEEPSSKSAEKSASTETVTKKSSNETLSVSDDSNGIMSDIDELHLLQKLHSCSAQSSTQDSDSESAIAISDSMESSDDSGKEKDDVISIENSSYSENEGEQIEKVDVNDAQSTLHTNDNYNEPEEDTLIVPDGGHTPGSVLSINSEEKIEEDTIQMPDDENSQADNEDNSQADNDDNSQADNDDNSQTDNDDNSQADNDDNLENGNVTENKITNNDDTDSMENVLLASDDESNKSPDDSPCVNLRDDCISIEETITEHINKLQMILTTRKEVKDTENGTFHNGETEINDILHEEEICESPGSCSKDVDSNVKEMLPDDSIMEDDSVDKVCNDQGDENCGGIEETSTDAVMISESPEQALAAPMEVD